MSSLPTVWLVSTGADDNLKTVATQHTEQQIDTKSQHGTKNTAGKTDTQKRLVQARKTARGSSQRRGDTAILEERRKIELAFFETSLEKSLIKRLKIDYSLSRLRSVAIVKVQLSWL